MSGPVPSFFPSVDVGAIIWQIGLFLLLYLVFFILFAALAWVVESKSVRGTLLALSVTTGTVLALLFMTREPLVILLAITFSLLSAFYFVIGMKQEVKTQVYPKRRSTRYRVAYEFAWLGKEFGDAE
jgi:hypothetical protein